MYAGGLDSIAADPHSPIVGSLPGFGSTTLGFASFWFQSVNPFTSVELSGVLNGETDIQFGPGPSKNSFSSGRIYSGLTVSVDSIQVCADNSYGYTDDNVGGGGIACFTLRSTPFPMTGIYDGNWHHIMWSWDTPIAGQLYIDNSPISPLFLENDWVGEFVANPPPPEAMNLAAYAWTVYPEVQNGGVGDNISLAEVFLLTGNFVDISDPIVRAKFINPNTLKAVGLGGDGSVPFGSNMKPQIYLSGDKDKFPLIRSTSNATFTVVGPALVNPTTDPFGNNAPP